MSRVVWSAGSLTGAYSSCWELPERGREAVYPAHKNSGPLYLLPQLHWYQMEAIIVLGSGLLFTLPLDLAASADRFSSPSSPPP